MIDGGTRIDTADNDSRWKEEIRGRVIVTRQSSAARPESKDAKLKRLRKELKE